MNRWRWLCGHRVETGGVAAAREAFERVDADTPQVEAIRAEHEDRIRRNDFGPKIAIALRLRRIR